MENPFKFVVLFWSFWIKYDLGQKYCAPQVRSNRGSNSWPSDHDSTFHVTEMLNSHTYNVWCNIMINDILFGHTFWTKAIEIYTFLCLVSCFGGKTMCWFSWPCKMTLIITLTILCKCILNHSMTINCFAMLLWWSFYLIYLFWSRKW